MNIGLLILLLVNLYLVNDVVGGYVRTDPDLGRIKAKVEDRPYVVDVSRCFNLLWVWCIPLKYCSGTLIDRQWVITAAHCHGGNTFRVYLGGESRRSGTAYSAEVAIKNPDFWHEPSPIDGEYYSSEEDDIMLLKLTEPVALGPRIRPALLPEKGEFKRIRQQVEENKKNPKGWWITFAGYGNDDLEGVIVDELIQTVIPPVLNVLLPKGTSSIPGDSGAGLIRWGSKDVVLGVLTGGRDCSVPRWNKPGETYVHCVRFCMIYASNMEYFIIPIMKKYGGYGPDVERIFKTYEKNTTSQL